ncbi:hypothetical protein CB1_000370040 [Camelus ferus]|nr:hypothetical protein CB1_000370040 [Camelus ferus]
MSRHFLGSGRELVVRLTELTAAFSGRGVSIKVAIASHSLLNQPEFGGCTSSAVRSPNTAPSLGTWGPSRSSDALGQQHAMWDTGSWIPDSGRMTRRISTTVPEDPGVHLPFTENDTFALRFISRLSETKGSALSISNGNLYRLDLKPQVVPEQKRERRNEKRTDK